MLTHHVVSLLCFAAVLYTANTAVFRQPVVFPPLDVSKYFHASDVELEEQPILASDGSMPEANHEHADEVVALGDDGLANETRDEPIVVARRSPFSAPRRGPPLPLPWHRLRPRLL